jgi:hypothetical protein
MTQRLAAQTQNEAAEDSSKGIVKEVEAYSEKNTFLSHLLRRIFVKDEQRSGSTPFDPDRKIIKKYTGKVIRKINIEILDVFGASVDNPKDTVRSWLQERGNSFHLKTRESPIKDMLIFSEGQIFTPFHILESERIIRQSPYVYDVRIIPQVIESSPDSVDLIVYVQDIWSLNGSAVYRPGSKAGNISFKDINFLGYGNELKGGLKYNHELTQGWDWNGGYTINNFEKTFFTTKLYHYSERDQQQYGLSINRDFFTPIIRWGGGIAQQWQFIRYPDLRDTSGHVETLSYDQNDYWLGYAFDLKPFDPASVYQNRFNIAGRISRTVYNEKPDIDTTNSFQDNTFYLGRIGYSYRTFYQDRYIFGLGRTEDIPLINMVALLFGMEKGVKSSRPYYGLKTSYSFYNDYLGYVYGGFELGAFRLNKKWLDRASFIELLYFSNLNTIGNYNWRHYIGSKYSYSYDPIEQQGILNINDESGVRGFSDASLKGNKKLVLNYEADIFIPQKFLDFKLAVITFADFGLISSINRSLITSKLYQGYGFGFRLRNEHLIFPTIQLMFGFYPNTSQAGVEYFSMFHQRSIYYHFNQYHFSQPSIIMVE